jgi:hydroxymethylpyrimidine pyrophosphatase-like HAD family hydrolase
MRYLAIALDYDGTIARDGLVAAPVLEGLRQLKASGRKLLLVTGRELEELLGIFPQIVIFDRVVAENGALLYRPDTQERRELGEPPPGELVEALKASGIPLSVGHTILATVRPYETLVLECIANLGLEQQVIFNKGAVMILPPGCNKASGLKTALAELGLSPYNLVAAGDGENDHSLLELAAYSVATANAVATLKAAADRVTNATHGEGVLEIIADLLDSDLSGSPPRRGAGEGRRDA